MADTATQSTELPITVGPTLDLAKIMEGKSTGPMDNPGISLVDAAAAIKALAAGKGNPDAITNAARAGITAQFQSQANAATAAQAQATQQGIAATAAGAVVEQMANRRKHEQEITINQVADSFATPQRLIDLNQQLRQKDDELDKQQTDLSQRAHNGFFDNPVQWMYDQFALPSDIKAFNVDVNQRNSIAERLSAASVDGTVAANFIKNTRVAQSAEMVEAENTKIAAEASAKIATAKAVQAQYSIPFMLEQSKLLAGAYSDRMAALNYNIAASNLKYKWDVEAPNMRLQNTMMQNSLADRKTEEALVATINAKLLPVDAPQKISLAAFEKMPAEQRQPLTMIALASNGITAFAPSQLLDAFTAAKTPINPKAAEFQQALRADYEQTIKTITAQVGDMATRTPEARKAAIDLEFNKRWNQHNTSQRLDSLPGFGMPSIGELNTFSGDYLGSQQNVIWNTLTAGDKDKPAIQQGKISTDTITNTALQLVSNGNLTTMEAAKQAATLYQTITAHNNKFADPAMFGVPAQTSWIASAAPVSTWGKPSTFDRTDALAWKTYLERSTAAWKSQRDFNTIGID